MESNTFFKELSEVFTKLRDLSYPGVEESYNRLESSASDLFYDYLSTQVDTAVVVSDSSFKSAIHSLALSSTIWDKVEQTLAKYPTSENFLFTFIDEDSGQDFQVIYSSAEEILISRLKMPNNSLYLQYPHKSILGHTYRMSRSTTVSRLL